MKGVKRKFHVNVGDTPEDTARRFIDSWHAMERGEKVQERHLSFESLEGLLSVLTPKRWQLLKFVHQKPAPSVRALALELKRDYRRVHEDVEILTGAGLLAREGRTVRADYDTIDSSFRFDQASG
jgi:predicted transcriptional regulator